MYPNEETKMALRNVEGMLLRENRKKDNKSLGLIQQGLDDMILSKVSNAESSKKAWDTLESCSKVKNVKVVEFEKRFRESENER